jgi:hypothetical protein
LSFRGGFELQLLNNVETLKTLGIYRIVSEMGSSKKDKYCLILIIWVFRLVKVIYTDSIMGTARIWWKKRAGSYNVIHTF